MLSETTFKYASFKILIGKRLSGISDPLETRISTGQKLYGKPFAKQLLETSDSDFIFLRFQNNLVSFPDFDDF